MTLSPPAAKLTPADSAGRVVFVDAFREGLAADPLMTVSEWADRHRRLDQVSSAEGGRYRSSRTPYLVEIMDALSVSSPVRDVVFMKGAQVGATEAANNWIGYVIDQAPGPMLAAWPRDDDMRRQSKTRIAPMIQASPRLRSKVAPPKSRDSGNTMDLKEFPGGVLKMTGAQSAAALRSMPVRYLMLDEIDAYPRDVDGEGDPIVLAVRRTSTFTRAKRFFISTPTVEGQSRVAEMFSQSDQRYYFVPCPECGIMQRIEWVRLTWEGDDPATVRLACEGCGTLIDEHHKPKMLAAGEWRATNPGARMRGYHLSALYSPLGWFSWAEAVELFLEAKATANPELFKVWANTVLGETYRVKGDAPPWRRLYERRKDWHSGVVPAGARVLTAGVDVQRNRLEVEVVGWGPKLESWSVDYVVLAGPPSEEAVWDELTELLNRDWPCEDGGSLRLSRLAVDAGDQSASVYAWCRQHGGVAAARVIAVRGRDDLPGGVVVSQPKPVEVTARGRKVHPGSGGVLVWYVNTGHLKQELYGWLRREAPLDGEDVPMGWSHFPADREQEWFEQLCAEQFTPHRVRRPGTYVAKVVHRWEKTRERNEALDCRVYARAAAWTLRLDRWGPAEWNRAQRLLGTASGQPASTTTPKKRRRRSDHWGRGGSVW